MSLLGGRFDPEKKIFSPPPPKFPNSPQTPFRPLALAETPPPPPPGIFNKKNRSPLPGASDSPSPSPNRKKNIRNVHQVLAWRSFIENSRNGGLTGEEGGGGPKGPRVSAGNWWGGG